MEYDFYAVTCAFELQIRLIVLLHTFGFQTFIKSNPNIMSMPTGTPNGGLIRPGMPCD